MPYYRAVGEIPPKRHTQFRRPDGGLYSEELMGVEGFSADSALLYHTDLPTAIIDSQEWVPPGSATTPNHPLKPRHLMTHKLDSAGLDAVTGRHLLLGNGDVRLSYVAATDPSPLYRNAIGDECVYVESGSGVVETSFGALTVGQGDYVLLPTSTIHRWVPRAGDACGCSSSRPPATSPRPSGTCRPRASSWSPRPTASATCARRPRRWSWRTTRSTSWCGTGPAGRG